MAFQKGYTPWNKKPITEVALIACACGCGNLRPALDNRGRPAKFIYGHGNRGRKFPDLKHEKQFQKGHIPFNKGTVGVNGDSIFKEGHKTNLGRKHPPEFGQKISLANRGREPFHFGDKHWNWKGGITPKDKIERLRFRKTIGKDVLRRDNYTCKDCGANKTYLHVDHIKPWANHIELRFDPENCITLCYKCHYKKTFGREMPKGVKWGYL